MKKKYIVTFSIILVGLIIVVFSGLLLKGNNKIVNNSYEEARAGNEINDIRNNNSKEMTMQDLDTFSDCNKTEVNLLDSIYFDDSVYREYSFGEKFTESEIVISKEVLLNTMSKPKSVLVYFNDHMIETICYNDTDIHVNLNNEGIYCFMVMDEYGETVDITSQIQGTAYPKDEIVKLR